MVKNKSTNRWANLTDNRIGLVLTAILILVAGYFLYDFVQTQINKNEFTNAREMIENVAKDFEQSHLTENNHCYYTEQGPYDDGVLWCSIEKRVIQEKALSGDQVKEYNYVLSGSNLMCSLKEDEHNPEAHRYYIFRCAGRAREAYYPMVGG